MTLILGSAITLVSHFQSKTASLPPNVFLLCLPFEIYVMDRVTKTEALLRVKGGDLNHSTNTGTNQDCPQQTGVFGHLLHGNYHYVK